MEQVSDDALWKPRETKSDGKIRYYGMRSVRRSAGFTKGQMRSRACMDELETIYNMRGNIPGALFTRRDRAGKGTMFSLAEAFAECSMKNTRNGFRRTIIQPRRAVGCSTG